MTTRTEQLAAMLPSAVTIPSRVDGRPRRYRVSNADAYCTLVTPDDADCAATWVGTRALLDGLSAGSIQPAA